MNNCFWFALIFSTILTSCRVGPRYEPPTPIAPEQWKQTPPEDIPPPPKVEYWWEVFDEPLLNELELQAVANNPDLFVALERVMEARALAGVEAANLYPQITLNPSYSSSGMLFKPFIPPGLFNSQTTSPINPPSSSALSSTATPMNAPKIAPFRIHQMQYLLPLNLNYEIDLWGKLRDRFDSAFFNFQAQIEYYCSALLTLTADLATTYFQLRSLDAIIVFLEQTLEARQKNYNLTLSRYNKGIVNYLDVTQAEIDLATVKANIDDSKRLRTLAENQIAILIGTIPSIFRLDANPLEKGPPEIPPGIPSRMLLRRPDIAQAERTMASEHALIGAAYASFFPSLSLTGALGFLSPDASHFLKWISRYWMVGADMSQMIFDGGRDSANLQGAIARFNEASGSYKEQVLIAFQEVEDALTNIQQYGQQAAHLKEAVDAAKKATRLSLNRYVNGVAIYLEVVENERLQLQTEINWMNVLNLRYAATIQLIKALGGSWL